MGTLIRLYGFYRKDNTKTMQLPSIRWARQDHPVSRQRNYESEEYETLWQHLQKNQTAITPNRELQSDEYFNETNHLIYCSKCNTPRQCRHELQGKVLIPSIRCKCQQEIFEQEEAQRKLHEKQMEIEHLKTSGLQDKSLLWLHLCQR